MLLRRRRNRRKETEGRATLMEVAAGVYEDGDTKATLKAKMVEAIQASGEDRPFLAFLMKILDALLPLLLKLLAGAAA